MWTTKVEIIAVLLKWITYTRYILLDFQKKQNTHRGTESGYVHLSNGKMILAESPKMLFCP